MADTAAVEQLASKVQGLSLDSVKQTYPGTFPKINPLDLWRAHISNVLHGISGVSTDIIYRAIQWTQGLDKGDFTLAVPALRVKGQKPDVLAAEWGAKVEIEFSRRCQQHVRKERQTADNFLVVARR
jgi:arginyl-tRNA synthetase